MKTKRKPADTAFSLCVRERAGWKCERCGKVTEPGSLGMHCSHVFSRRYRRIRWDPRNAQALCFTCHDWYGGNPVDSGRWAEEVLGEATISALRTKRDDRQKVTKAQEREIAKFYRKEHEKLLMRRVDGETGRIEFASWDEEEKN